MTTARREPVLRVLDAVLVWPPETFLQRKFAALAARGVEVTVASTVSRRQGKERVAGARLLRIPDSEVSRGRKLLHLVTGGVALLATRPKRFLALLRAAARRRPPAERRTAPLDTLAVLARVLKLARHEPQIAHFEWETAAAHYIAVTDVWHCPVVVSCRNTSIHLFPYVRGHEHWVGRLPAVFERASLVHCVSDAIKREAEQFGLDPAKARVIRPAVDPAVFTPAPARRGAARPGSDEPLRLAGVGELIWLKGWEYALHALYLLALEGVPVRFDLAGATRLSTHGFGERERIAATVADLGLADRVTLHGRLAPAAVHDLLLRSDALLHPSLCEGIPNAVLEAMACELPVVVTDAGGTAEAVRHGRDGFVVPRRDSAGLAAAVRSLWENPDRRIAMGREGRARVISDFHLDDQADAVIALYREAVGR